MIEGPERVADTSRIQNGEPAVPRNPTILVPIRYPLTDPSARTLERAEQIADERDAKELIVLHVDVFQRTRSVTASEIYEAIAPLVADRPVSVNVNRSFLVEEAILEEAESIPADVIVLGQSRKSVWRRVLDRLVGNDYRVAPFLCDRTGSEIIVVE